MIVQDIVMTIRRGESVMEEKYNSDISIWFYKYEWIYGKKNEEFRFIS